MMYKKVGLIIAIGLVLLVSAFLIFLAGVRYGEFNHACQELGGEVVARQEILRCELNNGTMLSYGDIV